MGYVLYVAGCFIDELAFIPDEPPNLVKQPFIYKSRLLV